MKLWMIVLTVMILLIAWGSWTLGYNAKQPVYLKEYIVNEIPIIEEVEVIKEVPVSIKLREFQTIEELNLWLIHWQPKYYFQGSVDFTVKPDCEDIAYAMVRDMIAQGYLGSTEILQVGEYGNESPTIPHMIVSIPIGNNIYFLEPATKEVWLAYYKD